MTLVLELDAPPRVAPGTSVTLVLRLRNTSAEPATLYLRGRTSAFDFIVSDARDVVWQRLRGAVVPAIARVVQLGPGETLELRDRWPLTGNDGRPVAAGRYSVVGLLLRDEPEPLRSGSVSIEIS